MKNPMDFFKMIKAMKNPQEAIIEMAGGNNNPILKNAIDMAKNGKNDDLMQLAQKLCKEKGIDFEKDFNKFSQDYKDFMNMFK